jgi:hypothetical protein
VVQEIGLPLAEPRQYILVGPLLAVEIGLVSLGIVSVELAVLNGRRQLHLKRRSPGRLALGTGGGEGRFDLVYP